ncbi:MAG TPA: bifunctional demethylmenaquinone methyltransferase/2-methoxy-6-polyprenyl-1,4-benzoquinol methylase UbiE [Candidatus Omnitrophica bacterium]|nr:MAG: hypothetical protein A2Z81_09505 [Omnitrophica WOR_2 bacterium GWA2_45_18]OGX18342.1 MAG: hypothetical protein A2Y04_05260 [Omnitrophica WOR_2 bacterium GWC2_45_7]HBR14031.1 bifunctional demethylmenaquinone methyltransferase/2-methoxy-6-polyprenyl-1,4-benzoquinol methylase UbiE [Candidatus Omnitrophota bacterium]
MHPSTDEKLFESKSNSWRMFNKISGRYDLLNHLLSFGLHARFRKKLIKFFPRTKIAKLIDIATGTADVLLTVFQYNKSIEKAYGIDMADKMLDIGRRKISQRKWDNQIFLLKGDARRIPFERDFFDVATIAFGIRNVPDPVQVLKEMRRILVPGGRALVLEFSLPQNVLLLRLHLFYLRNVVPFMGWIFSGNYSAYRYLNQTIESFPSGNDFCQLMQTAGFQDVNAHSLLGGVASIYQGDKGGGG